MCIKRRKQAAKTLSLPGKKADCIATTTKTTEIASTLQLLLLLLCHISSMAAAHYTTVRRSCHSHSLIKIDSWAEQLAAAAAFRK